MTLRSTKSGAWAPSRSNLTGSQYRSLPTTWTVTPQEVDKSQWIAIAMDQLLGPDTGRVFNDASADIASGNATPEKAVRGQRTKRKIKQAKLKVKNGSEVDNEFEAVSQLGTRMQGSKISLSCFCY